MRFLARVIIVGLIIYLTANEFRYFFNEIASAGWRWQQVRGDYGRLISLYPALRAGREAQRYLPAHAKVSLQGTKNDIESTALRYALYPVQIAEGQDFIVDLEAKRNDAGDGNKSVLLTEGISLFARDGVALSPQGKPLTILTVGQTAGWALFFFGLELLVGILVLRNLRVEMRALGYLWFGATAFLLGQVTLAFATWVMLLIGFKLTVMSLSLGLAGTALFLGIRSIRRGKVAQQIAAQPQTASLPCQPSVWLLRFILLTVVSLIFLLTIMTPVTDWDAMSKWIMKAKVIFYHQQLQFDYTHQNYYPLLWPIAIALQFVMMGGMFDQVVPWLSGLLFVVFVIQLARGLVLLGVGDVCRFIILITFVVLTLHLPVSDNAVFTNFICANAENLFLCLMTCALVMALQWMKFPTAPGYFGGCLISVLALSLVKLEGAVAAVVVLAGLWFWARADMTRAQKKCVVATGGLALLLPLGWMGWMKYHGYDVTMNHLGSPVTLQKILLILQMTGHILVTTKLIYFLVAFFIVAILWPVKSHKREDGFLLLVAVSLLFFALSGTLSWPKEWIVRMYWEGFNRLFLHAAPAMLFYCASRIVFTNKKGAGNG